MNPPADKINRLLCQSCGGRLYSPLQTWSELSGGKIKDLNEGNGANIEFRFRKNLARSGLTRKQQELAVIDSREWAAAEKRVSSKQECRCAKSRSTLSKSMKNTEPYTPIVLWTGHPSLWHYFWSFFWGIPLSLIGVGLLIIGNALISRAKTRYTITSSKVGISRGLLVKSSRELRIADVRSINIHRNGLAGLFGLGTVEFSSSASDGASVFFSGVGSSERVADVVRAIQEGHEPPTIESIHAGKSAIKSIGYMLFAFTSVVTTGVFALLIWSFIQTAREAREHSALPQTTQAISPTVPVVSPSESPTPTVMFAEPVVAPTPTPTPTRPHRKRP